MGVVRGTVRNGVVVLDDLADLPDGARVELDVVESDDLPEDDDISPDAIVQRLALMDRVRPWMTPEEEAAWMTRRTADKAAELAGWEDENRKLDGLFR